MSGEEVEGVQEARSSKDLCAPEGAMTWKTISRTAELKGKRQHSTRPKPGAIFSSVWKREEHLILKPKLMQFLLLHSEVIFHSGKHFVTF